MKPKEKKQDNISLCRSCYCMTKTIEGKCGKCKEKKQDWEKKRRKMLEDYFVEVEPNNKLGEFIVDGVWYAPKCGCDTLDMILDEVDTLLEQTREEVIDEYREIITKRMMIEKKRSENPNQPEKTYIKGKYIGLRYAVEALDSITSETYSNY